MTLSIAPTARKDTTAVGVEGRASIQGRSVTRLAVPADEMMQAFAYRHLVASDALRVAVLQRGSTRAVARLITPNPVRIAAAGRPAFAWRSRSRVHSRSSSSR